MELLSLFECLFMFKAGANASPFFKIKITTYGLRLKNISNTFIEGFFLVTTRNFVFAPAFSF